MPYSKGNPGPHAFKPKYTEEDLEEIRKDLAARLPVDLVFAHVYRRHPDVSSVSIFRWIEKVMKEPKTDPNS